LVVGHVVGGFVRRDKQKTQAEMYQAYKPQQQSYQQPAPQQQAAPQAAAAPAPPHDTIEQRIKRLEDLAAKGIITKQEYQTRRKAILNSI
jgi:hypothetical protein